MKKLTLLRANKTKFGGAENYLLRLFKELKKQGYDIKVINSTAPKFLPSFIKVLWFNLQICLAKGKKFYFSLERITCPDIYRAGDGVHKVFLKTKKRKLNLLNPVYLYLEKRCFYNAKMIIANSYMVKNQIINTYDIPKDKIEVVYNGINIKPLVDTQKIKKEFDLTDEKIVLYVGSGFERKGVKEALEIVSKLETKVKFIIIGKEKKLSYYEKLASSLQVDAIFTGPRSDVDEFYSLADIFLFPTHYEPFSNVILEAMSFECAAFTTKQNGAHEILENKYVLETPQDYTIVNKIDELLKNPKKLQAVKKQNLEIVQNFTIEKNAKKTMEIINEYLH